MNNIYFDNASTTAVRKEVFDEIKPYLLDFYGNASNIYDLAKKSQEAIKKARKQIADAICAKSDEIYFTAGGSESDNWAIKGVADALADKGKHIITTKIEHHAVLNTCKFLEKHGYDVTYIDVDEYGIVSIEDLKKAIRQDTILISVMFANNEIGTIEPIEEIGKIAHEKGIYFHTDAVQAVGHLKIDVYKMNIDMLSISGHKLGAPKGVGALYIKNGINISNLIHGGGQEKGKRAGTENVASIVGLGKAVELANAEIEESTDYITKMRDKIIENIMSNIKYCRLNGHPTKRLPGNVNISFEFIEGEGMLLLLNSKGICATSGSACTSGSLDPSHVLLAIGLPHENAHGSLRITLSKYNTMEEVDYFIKEICGIVSRLRDMSPLYEQFLERQK